MTATQTALDLPALVRQRDYRRFLAIQLADRRDRPVLYALTAFATEMAHIPAHINEPLAGFMRFAWWREALQAMEQGLAPRAHPLLQALAPWLCKYPQAFVPLHAIIENGQMRLEDAATPMNDAPLDALWEIVLGGPESSPLKSLKSLPLGGHIGPWRILKLLMQSLQH